MKQLSSNEFYYSKFLISSRERATFSLTIDEEFYKTNVKLIKISDLEIENNLEINEVSIPFLADEEVFYKGQIIAILLSYELENLEKSIEFLHLVYEDIEEYKTNEVIEKEFIFNHTECTLDILEKNFDLNFQKDFEKEDFYVYSSFDTDFLTIHTKTIDINSIEKNISKVLKISKNKIEVKKENAKYDFEAYFFYSILYSVAISLASYVCKADVFFKLNKNKINSSNSFSTKITYKTFFDFEIKKIHFTISLKINEYELFKEELLRLIILSSKSCYKLDSILITIKISTIRNYNYQLLPEKIISNINYCLEQVINDTASVLNAIPLEFREKNIANKEYKDMLIAMQYNSNFNKKFVSYNLSNKNKLKYINARGIGISNGFAINKYSTFPNTTEEENIIEFSNNKFIIKLIKDQVDESFLNFLKKMICRELGIEKENVLIKIKEAGASNSMLLSLEKQKVFLYNLVKKKIDEIKNANKESFSILNSKNKECAFLLKDDYNDFSLATCVVEINYDSLHKKLLIEKVSFLIDCGIIFDEEYLKDKIKKDIANAISMLNIKKIEEKGSILKVKKEKINKIDIKFTQKGTRIFSLENLVYNTLPSAYSVALSQIFYKNKK